MRNKITFIVFGNTGSTIHQAIVSKPVVIASAAIIALFLFSFVIVGYRYIDLKRHTEDAQSLKAKIAGQAREIANQNRQIQLFADKINGMKENLLELKINDMYNGPGDLV